MPFISKLLELSINTFGAPLGFVIFFLVPTIILSIPAWVICKKHGCLFWWEIGLPIYGMIFWLLCMLFFRIIDFKGESLVNLYVEPFIVAALSLLIVYIKPFVLSKFFENQKLLSFLCIVSLCVLILLMRLIIPALPE